MSNWRKASFSVNSGNCVEAGSWSGRSFVQVRDTGSRKGTVLEVPVAAWREFTARVKDGQPA
jgi:hypothetical protein